MSPETAFEWFVIYCENDDSHTLVDETKVICDDSVREGDVVKFAYPGVKDLLDGVVKAISRDKKKMIKEQDRLNKLSKPKREPSFHADRPRKAALQAKKVLGGGTTKAVSKETSSRRGEWPSYEPSCSSRAGKCLSQDGQQKPLSTLMQNVSSDESDDLPSNKNMHDSVAKTEDYNYSDDEYDDFNQTVPIETQSSSSSSSGSDMELTPAEQELLKKLTKKSRKRDNKDLSQLVSLQKKSRTDMEGNEDRQEENVKDSLKDKSARKSGDKEESKNSEMEVKDGRGSSMDKRKEADGVDRMDKKDERNGGMERIDKKTDQKNADMERGGKKKDEMNGGMGRMDKKDTNDPSMKMEFNGNFYRTSEATQNAIAFPSTNIYITEKQLKDVKRRGHTATATARMLLSYIYTDEAMAACSVSGVARINKTTKEVSQRPALHQEGVDAIIDFVTARASKKGWPCPLDSAIRQCLNNKLCEQRAEAKAREERRNQIKKKSE
ncbi:Putative BEN domain-containing protein B1 [Frankliniella fusca]|uniref:BEN domain-containing protein B1 n=1 Tax=Frankliniella fusca TaxID=407009 RepID=A0AAE1HRU4_9NEOP|nr:Putative BEN domain-containing protein B1 [Frankliniella fusca]